MKRIDSSCAKGAGEMKSVPSGHGLTWRASQMAMNFCPPNHNGHERKVDPPVWHAIECQHVRIHEVSPGQDSRHQENTDGPFEPRDIQRLCFCQVRETISGAVSSRGAQWGNTEGSSPSRVPMQGHIPNNPSASSRSSHR